MIPIGDASRRPVRLPLITWAIIAANVAMYLLELSHGEAFIVRWSVIPKDIAAGHDLITIFTAMFMHAGPAHILGNMLFLWVFGPEMEDAMGPLRYLAFYLIGGVIATVAQVAALPNSAVPNLGASGAIAAVMGGFLITYPRDRIRTILIIGWFIDIERIPAVIMVGVWFLMQVFMEAGALATVQAGGVAYMAHIGGFIYGAIAARAFEQHIPPPPEFVRLGGRARTLFPTEFELCWGWRYTRVFGPTALPAVSPAVPRTMIHPFRLHRSARCGAAHSRMEVSPCPRKSVSPL